MTMTAPNLPRVQRHAPRERIGLCLGGGGITGAMYEVGVLAALEDSFEGFRASDFDVFVGASSGSAVATALAGGMTAQRMYRALLDPADDFFPLQRHHLLRFDIAELRRVWASALGAARRLVGSVAYRPLELDVWTELDRFYDSLPAGLFTIDTFERFFEQFMQRRGISTTFDDLPRILRIIANDLDEGQRIVFGDDDTAAVPVPRAVAASCAVPILYAPVPIQHRDCIASGVGETGHVDVAVELGCTLVLFVDAMVPLKVSSGAVPTGHGKRSRVRDKGLLWVYNQTNRLTAQARLREGLRNYRADHPNVEVLVVEPDRSDATMFMYSPMNFAARRVILEDGYTATARRLRDPESRLRKAFESHGLAYSTVSPA